MKILFYYMEWRNGILLSYETLTNQWMIPGGGLEPNESENDCCIREVAEETGKIIQPSECLLEIEEYYEEWKWVNQYYIGGVVGNGQNRKNLLEWRQGGFPLMKSWIFFHDTICMQIVMRCEEVCILENVRNCAKYKIIRCDNTHITIRHIPHRQLSVINSILAETVLQQYEKLKTALYVFQRMHFMS